METTPNLTKKLSKAQLLRNIEVNYEHAVSSVNVHRLTENEIAAIVEYVESLGWTVEWVDHHSFRWVKLLPPADESQYDVTLFRSSK